MALGPGPLWNRRVGQQRLGCSSLEFLTGPAAAFGPKRVFSSVEWVMKLISKKKKDLSTLEKLKATMLSCLRVSSPSRGRNLDAALLMESSHKSG